MAELRLRETTTNTPKTLRSLFLTWSAWLLFFTLLAATALVTTTTKMRSIFEHYAHHAEQFDTISRLRTALYEYSRLSALYDFTHEKRYSEDAANTKARINALLTAAEADPEFEAHASIAKTAGDVRNYFRLREGAISSPRDGTIIEKAEADFSEIVAELGPIVEIRDKARQDALNQVTRWDKASNSAALFLAIAIVIAAIAGIFGFRSLIQAPLLIMHTAIRRYADGERATRVPPLRPVEINEVRDVFNSMADRLTMEDESRLTFLAGVAHDLRNPLTALKSSIDLLSRPLPEAKRTAITGLIQRQSIRLERMVSDFLDTTRIQAGHFDLQLAQTDLRRVIEEPVSLWQATTTKHILVTELPASPVLITCDPLRIEQVMNNLINNAIKYSPEGGTITITLQTLSGGVQISVSDEGIGIPADELDHIFDPFRRTLATMDTIPGVGIGLSTAKKIVEAHGGTVSVRSTPKAGSTFYLWLPTTPSQ